MKIRSENARWVKQVRECVCFADLGKKRKMVEREIERENERENEIYGGKGNQI